MQKERGLNVLSLFDGMSCGQIALNRIGKKVDNYYASEIDKYAIKATQANYPNTIQLGNIEDWHKWNLPKIDLIMFGSPCQGFSFAGKQLAFDDPRSKLFFTAKNVLDYYKPKYFLMENVRMKKEYLNIISKMLGVEPIMINSALVSAQNRVRYYWSNLEINQPDNKNIKLQDVILTEFDKKYILKDGWLEWFKENAEYQLKKKFLSLDSEKAITMTARQYASWNGNFITVPEATKKGCVTINPNEGVDLTFPNSKTRRGRRMEDKSNCLTAAKYNYAWFDGKLIRRLTPVECERLQTVPDGYTKTVSDNQRYKMLGNGWTVDVIAHIFKGIR